MFVLKGLKQLSIYTSQITTIKRNGYTQSHSKSCFKALYTLTHS